MPDAPRTESRGRRTRVAEGVYKDRYGLAATVKVHGVQREIRFPPSTPLKTIRARRDQLRASLRTLPHGARHTLAHDAGRYLEQVRTALVSIADRQRHLGRVAADVWPPAHADPVLRRVWAQCPAARVAPDALRLVVQPAPVRPHESGQGALRPSRERRLDRSGTLPQARSRSTMGAARCDRVRAGTRDRTDEDGGSIAPSALDRHAPVPDGPPAPGRLPAGCADPVRRRPARQGWSARRRAARRRRARRGARLHRARGVGGAGRVRAQTS